MILVGGLAVPVRCLGEVLPFARATAIL